MDTATDDDGAREWKGIPLPQGVDVRDDVVSIRFRFKGFQIRELSMPASRDAIEEADLTLRLFKRKSQALGEDFRYSSIFPDSPWCARFGEMTTKGRTFADAAQAYLATVKRENDVATYNTYRRQVDHRLVPHFGKQLINMVKTSDIVQYLTDLMDITDDQGIPVYSKKFYYNLMIPLRGIFAHEIIRHNSIATNPAKPIEIAAMIPKIVRKRKKKEAQPYSADERAKILAVAPPHWVNMLSVWWGTGMRAEEIIALKWSDIDLVKGIINVHAVIDEAANYRDWTKTEGSTRQVRMDAGIDDVVSALRRQRALTGLRADGWVFINPVVEDRWTKVATLSNSQWGTILRRAGVEHRGPNQCRHTYASERVTRGDNVWEIAKQLGHQNPEMLYRNYGKFLEEAAPAAPQRKGSGLRVVGK
jgi:integrase